MRKPRKVVRVTLRQKKINNGRRSLYLDFYPPIIDPETGKETRRQFLHLHILEKPKTQLEKQENKEFLRRGEIIKQMRENELNKPEIYSYEEKEKLRINELGEKSFITYFDTLTNKYTGKTQLTWIVTASYLKDFTDSNLKFSQVNESFAERFKEYLLTAKSIKSDKATLSANSANLYFSKFKTAIRKAFKDGLLQTNISDKVQAIKKQEIERDYLELEELQQLAHTPCREPTLKRMALFSALTGLRFSDIQKMTWSELEYKDGDGYVLKFKQQKTKNSVIHPITDQAYQLTEGKPNPQEMNPKLSVFNAKYLSFYNLYLKQWVKDAGISKNISFHCFRHTFAVIQLAEGTSIYDVSKLLGHKDLKTTQVYAKSLDKTKRKAVNKIKLKI